MDDTTPDEDLLAARRAEPRASEKRAAAKQAAALAVARARLAWRHIHPTVSEFISTVRAPLFANVFTQFQAGFERGNTSPTVQMPYCTAIKSSIGEYNFNYILFKPGTVSRLENYLSLPGGFFMVSASTPCAVQVQWRGDDVSTWELTVCMPPLPFPWSDCVSVRLAWAGDVVAPHLEQHDLRIFDVHFRRGHLPEGITHHLRMSLISGGDIGQRASAGGSVAFRNLNAMREERWRRLWHVTDGRAQEEGASPTLRRPTTEPKPARAGEIYAGRSEFSCLLAIV